MTSSATTQTDKEESASLGFGHQGQKKQKGAVRFNETQFRTEVNNTKLLVSIRKPEQQQMSPLCEKYGASKYNLHPDYVFPESQSSLIPRNTPDFVDRGEKYVERIVRALYYFKQCALIGPSGTGKTHVVYIVAEITGLPIWEINCGLQTSSYDMFGRYIGLGKENWIDGQIIAWCRMGGLLYLDEANMMKQDVATPLDPVLDTRGHLVLTEKDNDIVTRHPHAYVIISMNPFSAEFSGTKPLNAAFRRRMSVWINFDYESVGEKVSQKEVELLRKRTGVDDNTAYKVIRVGAEMRKQYKAGDLPYGPSVGDLVHWAVLIKDGSDPLTAAEETIIALTSDSVEVQADVRRL